MMMNPSLVPKNVKIDCYIRALNRKKNWLFHSIQHCYDYFRRVITHIHRYILGCQIDQGHALIIFNQLAKILSCSYSQFIGLAYPQFFRTLVHATPKQDYLSFIFSHSHLSPQVLDLLAWVAFYLYCCIFHDAIPFHFEALDCYMNFYFVGCIFHDAFPFHPEAEVVCYDHSWAQPFFLDLIILFGWLMHLRNLVWKIVMDSFSLVDGQNFLQYWNLSHKLRQQNHSILHLHHPFTFQPHHFHLYILSKTQVFQVPLLIILKP